MSWSARYLFANKRRYGTVDFHPRNKQERLTTPLGKSEQREGAILPSVKCNAGMMRTIRIGHFI